MNRLSSLVIVIILFAFVGKAVVASFCPEVLTVAVTPCDRAEESAGEDEQGEDDKVLQPKAVTAQPGKSMRLDATPPADCLLMVAREILVPPPQA